MDMAIRTAAAAWEGPLAGGTAPMRMSNGADRRDSRPVLGVLAARRGEEHGRLLARTSGVTT